MRIERRVVDFLAGTLPNQNISGGLKTVAVLIYRRTLVNHCIAGKMSTDSPVAVSSIEVPFRIEIEQPKVRLVRDSMNLKDRRT